MSEILTSGTPESERALMELVVKHVATIARLREENEGSREEKDRADTTIVEMGKVIERLREEREDSLSRWNQVAESEAKIESLRHAADALAQSYAAERETVERLQKLLRDQTDLNVDLQVQAEEQQRENERLREALTWLLVQVDDVKRTSVVRESFIYRRARAALANQPTEEKA